MCLRKNHARRVLACLVCIVGGITQLRRRSNVFYPILPGLGLGVGPVTPDYSQLNFTVMSQLCDSCSFIGRTTCLQHARSLHEKDPGSFPSESDAVEWLRMAEKGRCEMVSFLFDDDEFEDYFDNYFEGEMGDENSVMLSLMNYLPKQINDTPGAPNSLLQSPLPPHIPKDFKFYIYDSLHSEWSIGIERQVIELYTTKQKIFENFKVDLAIHHLFRSHPCRVFHISDTDTEGRGATLEDIDLFVVPYPHASHCIVKDRCQYIPKSEIKSKVLDNLKYFEGDLKRRHLFVNGMESYLTDPLLGNLPQSISLNLGPRLHKIDDGQEFEHITVPYFNDDGRYQPSIIHSRLFPSWYTRPRKYSFVYFFGADNPKMRGNNFRVHRQLLLNHVAQYWKNVSLIGGKPYLMEQVGMDGKILVGSQAKEHLHTDFVKAYSQSTFCPCLPGDAPSQKRFFDVILAGCIPVVLKFHTNKAPNFPPHRYYFDDNFGNNTSWHAEDGVPIQDSFPWIKHSHSLPHNREIDYASFVVEIEGGVKNLKHTLEALMANETEIQRMQYELGKVTKYFTYGVGKDANRHEDAFSLMLESVIYSLGHKR